MQTAIANIRHSRIKILLAQIPTKPMREKRNLIASSSNLSGISWV